MFRLARRRTVSFQGEVTFTDALVLRTQELLSAAKRTANAGRLPAPLRNSPKCEGCSLNGICLPDEINALEASVARQRKEGEVRPLVTERDPGRALYVQLQGGKIGLDGGTLVVTSKEREVIATARLFELSEVVIWGNASISAQAIRELCDRQIPVCWLTYGGWFSGMTEGLGSKNIELRRAQFRVASDEAWSLRLARRLVATKITNSRTLLRRNHRGSSEAVLRSLCHAMEAAESAESLQVLLGIEGNAAKAYFAEWEHLLRPIGGAGAFVLSLDGRNRRPPKDPVNALLSFTYSMLTREVTVAAKRVGFDPFLGFYHQPRFGRPALALDLMEEFRPILADSVVLNVINTGVVTSSDFIRSHLGVALKPEARKRVLKAWDRRMTEEVTHPVFEYRLSYRRVLEVQCRLLGRHLLGELENYPEFKTR